MNILYYAHKGSVRALRSCIARLRKQYRLQPATEHSEEGQRNWRRTVPTNKLLFRGEAKRYANRKPMFVIVYDCNTNVCPISYRFRDIRCLNLHDLDLDL